MIEPLLLKLALCLMAGILNGGMDTHHHHWGESVFKNWGSFWQEQSWRNKYKLGDPRYGRKKFLGIVVPVWVTDGWHLMKFSMLYCLFTAMAMHPAWLYWLWDALGSWAAFTVGFYAGYTYLFIKR